MRFRVRQWRFAAPVATVMLLAAGCTGEEPGGSMPETPATSSAVPDHGEVPFGCSGWANPPVEGGLEVYRAYLQYDPEIDGHVNWTVIAYNRSDLKVIDMTVTLEFTRDGEDVTEQVDPPPPASGIPFSGSVKPRENTSMSGLLNFPAKWAGGAEFTATVTADAWCVPTP